MIQSGHHFNNVKKLVMNEEIIIDYMLMFFAESLERHWFKSVLVKTCCIKKLESQLVYASSY